MSTPAAEHEAEAYLEHCAGNAWDMALIGEVNLGYEILLRGLLEAREVTNITPNAERLWGDRIGRYVEAFGLHP